MFSRFSRMCRGSSLTAAAIAAVAAVAAVSLAGTSHGSVVAVDVQFIGSGGSTPASFSGNQGAYTGDGVTSPVWNVITIPSGSQSPGTTNGLLASTGTATSVNAAYNFQGIYTTYSATSPGNNLLRTYTNSVSGYGNNVTLSGLTDNGSYQLYLYAADGSYNSGGSLFTFGAGAASTAPGSNDETVAPATHSGDFQENANYVVFNVTASATGTIEIIPKPLSGTPTYRNGGTLNGLQLVSSSVPEPATLGLVGVGALGLMLIGRKRRTAGAEPRRSLT